MSSNRRAPCKEIGVRIPAWREKYNPSKTGLCAVQCGARKGGCRTNRRVKKRFPYSLRSRIAEYERKCASFFLLLFCRGRGVFPTHDKRSRPQGHTIFFTPKARKYAAYVNPEGRTPFFSPFRTIRALKKLQMCRVCHGGCVVRLFRMKRRDSPPGRAQTGPDRRP